MNSSELLIRPVILEDDERPQDFDYPLVDINLVLTSHIPSVYVMRGQLDIHYLERAIAIAAGRMRATCGRVVKLTDGKHPYGVSDGFPADSRLAKLIRASRSDSQTLRSL
jgi:hypothetical protein